MVNKYKKKQRKASKRSTRKIPKSFRRRKRKKPQYHREHNMNLSEKEKEKKVEYMENYYLGH